MSDDEVLTPSETALEIARLKAATMKALSERSKLPQPLFWSLFKHKIEEIKKGKATRRLLREVLSGIE